MSHIQRCIECKVAQDAGQLAQSRLEEAKRQIDALLLRHLPSDSEAPKRDLLRLGTYYCCVQSAQPHPLLN